MFWLHHAMVDRIWWAWQNSHAANKHAFEGRSIQDLGHYAEFPNGGAPWLGMWSLLPTDGIMREGTTLRDMWVTRRTCFVTLMSVRRLIKADP
jgi:tyrosinase